MANIRKIDKDICNLINEYSIRRSKEILLINYKAKSNIDNELEEIGLKDIKHNILKESFEEDFINILDSIIERSINTIIIYSVEDLSFNDLISLANVFFHNKVKEIILVRLHRKDKEKLKAFTFFYEPYRTISNVLLLRRFKG